MRKYLLASVTIFTALIVFGAYNRRELRTAYHRYQMERNYAATFASEEELGGGFRGYTLGDSYYAYEHHRDRLVELGQLDSNHYVLEHLVPGTEERRHFWRLICRGMCPKNIDAIGEREENGKPWKVTVWCWPEDSADWDAYIAARDTSSYSTDFMTNADDDMRTKP